MARKKRVGIVFVIPVIAWWMAGGAAAATAAGSWWLQSGDTPRYEMEHNGKDGNGNGKTKKWVLPAIVGAGALITAIILLRKKR